MALQAMNTGSNPVGVAIYLADITQLRLFRLPLLPSCCHGFSRFERGDEVRGETIQVPPKRLPFFKVSRNLAAQIDGVREKNRVGTVPGSARLQADGGGRRTTDSRSPLVSFGCPICGYDGLDEEPRPSADGGSFEICPSCGFQFGVSDDDKGFTYDAWRKQWIDGGMVWDKGRSSPPSGWNPVYQLARLGVFVRR